jgi:hypothetical protein
VDSFARDYLETLSLAIIAVFPAALACGLVFFFLSMNDGQSGAAYASAFSLLAVAYSFGIGVTLVVFVGAPIYAVLVRFGQDKWPLVLLIGAAPSLLFQFGDKALAPFALGCGVAVAAATHYMSRAIRNRRNPGAGV